MDGLEAYQMQRYPRDSIIGVEGEGDGTWSAVQYGTAGVNHRPGNETSDVVKMLLLLLILFESNSIYSVLCFFLGDSSASTSVKLTISSSETISHPAPIKGSISINNVARN